MIQYVPCLRNIHNQNTAICRQILRVDIEVVYTSVAMHYYLSLPDIRYIFL